MLGLLLPLGDAVTATAELEGGIGHLQDGVQQGGGNSLVCGLLPGTSGGPDPRSLADPGGRGRDWGVCRSPLPFLTHTSPCFHGSSWYPDGLDSTVTSSGEPVLTSPQPRSPAVAGSPSSLGASLKGRHPPARSGSAKAVSGI